MTKTQKFGRVFDRMKRLVRFPFYETGRYKIYFRIWPFAYFVSKDITDKRILLMRKEFDGDWGEYRWKEI